MRRVSIRIAQVFGFIILLSGCANLNTISRTTGLPSPVAGTSGKVVHLDVQQRLLLVNHLGRICAEPSPDAMAAYAASLSAGASAPGTGSASAAGGGQSSAASIGLRTQSITLMRDALYRMCEAYANDALGRTQITTLLGRSQDLTAVILAVEQLTGAVAAKQAILSGSTSSSATASLVSSEKQLDGIRKIKARKEKELEGAKAEVAKAEKARDEQKSDEGTKKATFDQKLAADPNEQQQATKDARQNWQRSKEKLQNREHELEAATKTQEMRDKSLSETVETERLILDAKDSAVTAATAGTSSSGQFGATVVNTKLDKEASIAVANAVESMVKTVIDKKYTEESCMAMLTYIPEDYHTWPEARKKLLSESWRFCRGIIEFGYNARLDKATFEVDKSTARIEAWLNSDPGNLPKLKTWMSSQPKKVSITLMKFGGKYAGLRKAAITALNIP